LTSDLLDSIKSFFITINEGGWEKRKAKRADVFCLKIDLIVLKRKIPLSGCGGWENFLVK